MIRNAKCEKCPSLSKKANHVCMMGAGPKNPDIMVLMEHPEVDEDVTGHPRTGRQVRFLEKQLLRPVGVDPDSVFIDYAVRCRPFNKKISRKDVIECRPYLEKTIKAVKPKVLIVMGNASLCSALFLDKVGGITKWRGKPLWSREFNCWIVPTYGPSLLSFVKSKGFWFQFEQTIADMKLACQLVGKSAPKFDMPKHHVLHTPESIIKYMKLATASGVVAVDTETDGFDPRNEILGASFTFKKGEKYYPIYINWKDIDEVPEAKDAVSGLLDNKRVRKLLHNVSFDRKFFHFHGYRLQGPVDDTMIMAHLLNENFSVGLKPRTWTDLSFGGYDNELEQYKFDHKFTKKSSYKDIPFEVMAPYASYDTLATYMLWEVFKPLLGNEGLVPLYKNIVMPVRMVMTDAEINGIHVNMKQAEYIKGLCEKSLSNLEAQIFKLVGYSINFNAPQQIARLLFEELKAPSSGVSRKTKQWKCDKAALTKVAEWSNTKKASKIARALLEYKYITKLNSTYIGQAERNVWDDGCVHSNYNSTGTVTGRVSNSKPCTHNIPRDKMIRSLYGPSPGNVLVEADIKAAEMRTIAWESQDPVLLEIINSGQDIHNQTYNQMFNKPEDYVPNVDERRIAKAINFGLVYGITAVGLSRRLGLTEQEAQKFINLYFVKFRGVGRWMRETVKFARENGYVVSLFKRRRRLTEMHNDDQWVRWGAERQAMNSPIQSAAADFTYIGLIRVSKALKAQNLRAKIIHTVHDCVLVDTPPAEVSAVKAIIDEAFNTPVKAFPMQMEVDIEEGSAWGESGDPSELEKMLTRLAA